MPASSDDGGRTPVSPPRQRAIFITGMSGAGKSSALNAFEDLGYEVVDNLPLSLVERLFPERSRDIGGWREGRQGNEGPEGETARPLAIGVDLRTRGFNAERFLNLIARLRRRADLDVVLLFFDASDDTLVQRFSESRRPHPVAQERPLIDGIARERESLASLLQAADFVYDTSGQTVRDLRRRLALRYHLGDEAGLQVMVLSFGFARGVPRDADLVFDVRFLRNPHYDPQLRPLSGRDEAVARHIEEDPDYAPFIERLTDLLGFLLPRYEAEGKSYLTIACGCTGGRHRSVHVAERLHRHLAGRGFRVSILHRDVDRHQADPLAAVHEKGKEEGR